MSFNIYKTEKPNNESDVYKKNWSNWKKLNEKTKSIFIPVHKEFEEYYLQNLSGGACKLYIFLGLKSRQTGESWYSIQSMADFFKVSSRTIDKWIQEIEDYGLIHRERHGASTTTYLIPYSLNIIDSKITSDISLEEALVNLVEKATSEQKVVGEIYRIFHLFQWTPESTGKSIEAVSVTTKKKSLKYQSYNSYIYLKNFNNPTQVISEPNIEKPHVFKSPLNTTENHVYGIALENEFDLSQIKNQRDALVQLCNAPLQVIQNFTNVNYQSLGKKLK